VSCPPFPLPVPPLLWLTSSHHRAVSRFLPIELRRAHCLCFIFRQYFVSSPSHSSRNWSIKSTLSPQLPSSDRPTPTFHCYKKIISILITLPTTQPRLHFVSSLARAPRHQSFTRRHHYLSLPSHTHHSSTQRHPQWWTSQPSFAFRRAYRYMNSYKKIF
jgi:hypothetical protein